MSIKLSPLALLAGLAMFSQSLWASEASSGLVGHWELVDQKYDLTIEFKDNGGYIALTNSGVMTGRWEQLDESRLSTWNSGRIPKRVSEFTIEGDLLIITDESGVRLTHRRILLSEP